MEASLGSRLVNRAFPTSDEIHIKLPSTRDLGPSRQAPKSPNTAYFTQWAHAEQHRGSIRTNAQPKHPI